MTHEEKVQKILEKWLEKANKSDYFTTDQYLLAEIVVALRELISRTPRPRY